LLPPTLTLDVDYAAIAGKPRTTPSLPPKEARRRAADRGALVLLARPVLQTQTPPPLLVVCHLRWT
jgi:hypothetical protein